MIARQALLIGAGLLRLSAAVLKGLEAAMAGHRVHGARLAELEASIGTPLEAVREIQLPGFALRIEENAEHAGVTLEWRDAIPMAEVYSLVDQLTAIEDGEGGAEPGTPCDCYGCNRERSADARMAAEGTRVEEDI